ncbi:MAG TPA: hypothetical protein VL918_12935 [Sphingobium sp.]|nr:hypothetical protein [Sphingobium sp.]
MIVGRPVRFVAMVIGGWTAMRMMLFLPEMGSKDAPLVAAQRRPPSVLQQAATIESRSGEVPAPAGVAVLGRAIPATRKAELRNAAVEESTLPALADPPRARPATAYPVAAAATSTEPIGIPGPPRQGGRSSRWSGATWLLWRPDSGTPSLAPAGRLGGSQAGIRLDYALDDGSPLRPVLYARLSGALVQPLAAEAAAGIALRPAGLPLSIAVERRAALSRGGRNDFALVVAGGVYQRPLTRHLRVDGYGQAGIVGLSRADAFADGRLAVEGVVARLAGEVDGSDVTVGAAFWGGAQPGLARLDIGPQLNARFPVGAVHVRISADWRQRIAGDVRPASGPALTISLDL